MDAPTNVILHNDITWKVDIVTSATICDHEDEKLTMTMIATVMEDCSDNQAIPTLQVLPCTSSFASTVR